jgi:FtsP/CotA-like multicopper oxidase with cupredoxin domain
MSAKTQKFNGDETVNTAKCRRRTWLFAALCAAALVAAVVAWPAEPTSAQQSIPQQYVPCPPEQQSLLQLPELAAVGNILRGTIMLSDEQQAIPVRFPPQSKPGDPGSVVRCQPQYVRMLRGVNATPAPPASTGQFPNPMPGPLLRARVGDIINLTFINQINAAHFGRSIDNGETGVGCDKPVPPGDVFPDCFHGSSTGNIHFHGTHTNPNTTGDNVFVEVRPLPRDNQGKLTTTPEKVQEDLDKFFAQCTDRLKANVLSYYPRVSSDMPSDWTDRQKGLLKDYDNKLAQVYGIPPARALSPINTKLIAEGKWPQYFIGVYPYCFRLPEYKDPAWPPTTQTASHSTHGTSGGAGTAELNAKGVTPPEQQGVSPSLIMGQSPGTHWYHAHKHGSTAINVANGMTGVFIIEGPYDDDLNNFYGANWTRTQPVLVINQLGTTPNLLRGGRGGTDKGPNFTVNGQYQPVIDMRPGEVQMWRIVNTSGRAAAQFAPPPLNSAGKPSQFEWRQLAQDGVQFSDHNYQNRNRNKTFFLSSGNRADLLVRALPCSNNAATCTYPVLVQNNVDPSDLQGTNPANKVALVHIKVSGAPVSPTSPAGQFIPKAPHFPAFLNDITEREVTGGRTMRFASTGPNLPAMAAQHTIDGKKFDGNKVGALVKLNTVEEWKIVNETYGPQISHPFHIHINPFQVTEVFDPNELVDPNAKAPLQKYVFIDPSKPNPPKLLPGQCALNPYDESTWRSMKWVPATPAKKGFPAKAAHCVPTPVPRNNIWWDVFPIPSGQRTSFPFLDKDGKPVIDPKTGQPVIDPATGKPKVVQVPGYFKMRSRFVDYAGYYVLHCHILAHEDRGMMTVVEVSPAPMPYSHH